MKKLLTLVLCILSILPCQNGDMNRDGKLTITDLVILRKAMHSYDLMGDLNYDRIVDEDDLNILRHILANK